MKYFAYKFWKGMEICTDRKYTSFVVDIVTEIQPSGEELNLIVYKDWNPYKEIWDYHIAREIELSFEMSLYKKEWESDSGTFLHSMLKPADIKRIKDSCIVGPDGKKPTLDDSHMKEVFSKYEITKEWDVS